MDENTVRIEIPIETVDNTEAGTESAEKNLKEMADNAEKASEKMKKASDSVSKYDQAAKKAKESVDRATQSSTKFDRAMERAQRFLSKWTNEKYEVLLEAKDKITSVLQKINPTLKGLGGKAWTVTVKALDLATAPLRGIMNLLKNPLFQVGAVLGVSVSLKDTVDTYSTFEATMSRVKALSNANAQEMEQLTQKAKDMGAATKFSGTESAEAFTYMAQAGWGVQDMLDGIQGIMSLSAADGLDLASTTDIVANALTAFGLKAKDSGSFADVMATASSASNTDVYDLGEAFKYVAPVAGAMKYSIQDVSLALGIMSNNAVKGSMAGTSLKTSLANMAAPTDAMAEAMEKYGISLTDSQGNMKTLRGVMDNLRQGLGGLSEAEQTAAASTIFGKEAMAGMLAVVNASEEDYKKLAEQIDNSEGSADRMAETMQDNLAGALEQLGGAVETAQLTLGKRLKPYIQAAATWLTEIMPDIEKGLDEFMDYADTKIEQIKRKIKTFTSTEEWANADFFGKFKISWDELIAEPFMNWWESSGRSMLKDAAGNIGNGIGTAISTGLLALLGIDMQEAVGEGASVGSAFASGLIEGFDVDAIQEKLWSAIQGIFSNAAKILPGGEKADLSSWLSAAMIAKIGMPILSMGGSIGKAGWNLGKGIYQSAKSGLLKKVIGSFSLTGELPVLSMTTGSGLAGMLGKAGVMLGSGATTSTGQVLAGAGAATGALIGGLAVVDAGSDIYTAITTDDPAERKKSGTRGVTKLGMVGAGAAAGAAIGSVIPVLGTGIGALVGAGIGGLGALFAGDKVADSISKVETEEEKLEERQEELNAVTAEMKRQNLENHFGKIALSLADVKNVAEKVIEIPSNAYLSEFADSLKKLEVTEESLSQKTKSINKYLWKASIDIELSEAELSELGETLDAYGQEAIDYVQEQQYTATLAIDLLIEDPGENEQFKEQLNTYYGKTSTQLMDLRSHLNEAFQAALDINGDGGAKITLNEAAIISDLQQQIADITKKISENQFEAKMEVLQFKYAGGDLSAESFSALQTELQGQVAETTAGYYEAMELSIGNAKAMLQDPEMDFDESDYQEMIEKIKKEGLENIGDIELKAANFQLDALMGQYDEEIKTAGINEKIKEGLSEAFRQSAEALKNNDSDLALNEALSSIWSEENVRSMLGIDQIDAETQSVFQELFESMAPTRESLNTLAEKYQEFGLEIPENISSALRNIDLVGMIGGDTDAMWRMLNDEIAASAGREIGSGEAWESMLEKIAGAGGEIPGKMMESLESVLSGSEGEGYGNSFAGKLIENALQGIEGSGETIGPAISQELNKATEDIDTELLANSMANKIGASMSGADYSAAGTAVDIGVGGAIEAADLGSVSQGVDLFYNKTQSEITQKFSTPFSANADVNVNLNWSLLNPTADINVAGGGSTTVSASIGGHARGGFVSGRQLSWVGEEGPEAIIPLVPSRRGRALELYKQTGELLGLGQYADGGIVGGWNLTSPLYAPYTGISETETNSIEEIENSQPGENQRFSVDTGREEHGQISVSVSVSPTFQISGTTDETAVLNTIRRHMRELADELGGQIAENIETVFENTPVKKGA